MTIVRTPTHRKAELFASDDGSGVLGLSLDQHTACGLPFATLLNRSRATVQQLSVAGILEMRCNMHERSSVVVVQLRSLSCCGTLTASSASQSACAPEQGEAQGLDSPRSKC